MKKYIIILTSLLFTLHVNAQLTVDTNNGNVGIKTTTPEEAFTINGNASMRNAGTRYFYFNNTYSGPLDNIIDKNGIRWQTLNQGSGLDSLRFYQTYNYAENKMFFDNDDDFANGVGMAITQLGDVGVNTADPLNPLHVAGDALFASNAGSLKIGFPTSFGFGFSTIGGGTTLQFDSYSNTSTKTGQTTHMRLRNTGVLEVLGDIEISGEYLGLSDRRIKENVESIENGLEKIIAMNPVSYDFKTTKFPELNLSDNTQFGLIAQELESIEPSLVSENGKVIKIDDTESLLKSVNYIEVIPFLISAIQELNDKLEAKDVIIAENTNEYDALVSRLDALEAMISAGDKETSSGSRSIDK